MNRTSILLDAQKAFHAGKNVVQHIQAKFPKANLDDVIEFSYDLQAGSYIAALEDPSLLQLKQIAGNDIAALVKKLNINSLCEAGIGEATTLKYVVNAYGDGLAISGFDISLSRLLYAQRFLSDTNIRAKLFLADMLHIPLENNSVDAILTYHSLEPNRGLESEILTELHRVSTKYLILIEPDYNNASLEQKARMDKHNYIRNLPEHLAGLPGKTIHYEPWTHNSNELNRASIIVFEKPPSTSRSEGFYVSPVTKQPLTEHQSFYSCKGEGCLYPCINGIPVLRSNAAIVCSKSEQFF